MLPSDPFILLSYLNTQLRDFYPSLEEMCKSLGFAPKELEEKLAKVDYFYDSSLNQFV